MHQRNLLRIVFLALAIGTIALAWPRQTKATLPADSCHESMETMDQPEKGGGKLLFESLPNQFFSTF